jgi:exonuclease SbcD
MRILHTADWHLGRIINGYDLIEMQQDMVKQVIQMVKDHNVDVIVIAGDIYDRAIPSVEAIQLFDNFLTFVAMELRKKIIIITGNHDSYERSRFGNDIFKRAGIYIAKGEDDLLDKITVDDEFGAINFYLWPYCSYYLFKEKHPDQNMATYNDCFQYMLSKNKIDFSQRNCFVGHSYYTYGMEKCLESDSERQLAVGGAEYLDAKLLEGFDIAMFGHLHGAQKVGSLFYRYSGTPLKYSFSEVNHHKGITIYDFKEKGDVNCEEYPIKPLHDMKVIKGYLANIVKEGVEGVAEDDLIQLILLDEEKIFEPMAAVKTRYPNVLELKYVEKEMDEYVVFDGAAYKSKDIPELFFEFYEKISNNGIKEEEQHVVKEVYSKMLVGAQDENK